ncbi:MAG: GGDEF domain-containing protein [Dermatophilaceae bacterium]
MNEPDTTLDAEVAGHPGDDCPLPPAVQAARRAPARRGGMRAERAYPVQAEPDGAVSGPQLGALRALLHARSADQIPPVLATFIHDLGGGLVPARLADPANTLPMDVSLGLSEPLLPYADPVSIAAMQLARLLPEMMEDAHLVVMRLQGELQRVEEATRDPLTGLLTRRAWMRRLAEADPGDSVCLIDLDRFKSVNDGHGHSAGDSVLRAFGAVLLRSFRQDDSCGRYGGDELTCLTPGLSARALAQRCEMLREQWDQQRPECAADVGLSIGVATVTAEGGRAALQSADKAMYRAKGAGRGRTVIADESAREAK